jgi:hypothetical protein
VTSHPKAAPRPLLRILVHLLALGCALPCAVSAQLSAQRSATLTGVVTDPSGAVIAEAAVTLHPTGKGSDITASTDRTGRYTIAGQPRIPYIVVITAAGFATYAGDPLQLAADKPRTLDIRLKIEVPDQQVTVSDSNALDTDPSRNGDSLTLSGKDIDTLPLDSNELLQQLQGLAGSASPDIFVDGFSGGTLPPRDTIREIRINQNPYSAQNDTNPSNGRIEVFTKPGSGHFHGDFYSFGNSSGLNTANPFNSAQPPYYSYAMYSNFSGPINKHMSFSVEGGHQDQQTNALIDAQALDANLNQVYITQAVVSPNTTYHISPRIDAALGKRNTLASRYAFTQTSQTNGGIGQFALASQGFDNVSMVNSLYVSNSFVVSKAIVNDTRVQYVRSRVRQTPDSTAPTIAVSGAFTGGGNAGASYNDNQDRFELQHYYAASAGKHFLNFGGRFRSTRDANHSLANYNGTFTFASLALAADCTPLASCNSYQVTEQQIQALPAGQTFSTDYAQIQALGGGPSQFSITQGNPNVAVLVADGALFLQDDWKAAPNFTLSGGLRFETQNLIADHADWAPRLGFAWGIKKKKDKPPLYMLRGGAGIFYSRFTSGYALQAARQNGITQQQYLIADPHFFFPGDTAANLAAANLAGSQVQSTTYQISPIFHAPYNISTTLSLERQIKTWGSITVSYLSNRGVHAQLTRNINAPLPGTYNPAVAGSGTRPLGGTQNVYEYESGGVFRQNRITSNFFLRFKEHYMLYGFYQLHFDTADTAGSFPSNQYDIGADEGRSANDIRHSAYAGVSVQLPFRIQLNSFSHAQSGTPFNITVGQDLNGDSIFNDRPAFATDLTRASVVQTRFGAFDTSPTTGQTIIPINYGHGPGFFAVNLNLNRSFSFGPELKPPAGTPAPKLAPGQKPHIDRKFSIVFAIDAQNAFNQVNLAPPVGTLNSPLFGRSIALASGNGSTSANRIVEFETYFRF